MVVKVKCRFPKLCKHPHTDDGVCDKFCSFNTREVKTNADRIRSMSDEELAEKLTWIVPYCGDCPARIGNGEECAKDCKKAWLAWLRKEVEDG